MLFGYGKNGGLLIRFTIKTTENRGRMTSTFLHFSWKSTVKPNETGTISLECLFPLEKFFLCDMAWNDTMVRMEGYQERRRYTHVLYNCNVEVHSILLRPISLEEKIRGYIEIDLQRRTGLYVFMQPFDHGVIS